MTAKYQPREYANGEVILLFSEISADPEGEMCVAYSGAGNFYPVDPEVVIKNSKPAVSRGVVKRLVRDLKQEDLPEDFDPEEDTGKLAPVSSKKERQKSPRAFKNFPRLKHHFA